MRFAGFVFLFAAATAQAQTSAELTWDLSPLYSSDSAWSADLARARGQIGGLRDLAGRALAGDTGLVVVLDRVADLRRRTARLASYGQLLITIDSRDPRSIRLDDSGHAVEADAERAILPIEEEIRGLGSRRIRDLIASNPAVAAHRRRLLVVMRDSAHQPSISARAMLEAIDHARRTPIRAYNALIATTIGWPTIPEGATTAIVDQAGYARLAGASHRITRFHAADQYYAALRNREDAIGSLLVQRLQMDDAAARLRGFGDGTEAFFHNDGIPPSASDTMLAETRAARESFLAYFRVRRRALGLNTQTYVDLRMVPPLATQPVSLADARVNALAVAGQVGPRFRDRVGRILAERRWHLEPLPNKRRTAGSFYSIAGNGVPFGSMYFQGDLASSAAFTASTIAMGTWDAVPRNPGPDTRHDPGVFANAIGDGARMLHDDLAIQRATTARTRMHLLVRAGDDLRLRYYRAAANADFERRVRTALVADPSLTGEAISALYLATLNDYYGGAGGLEIEPFFGREWMNHLNFFEGGAVQGFAISYAAAVKLVEGAQRGDTMVTRAFDSVLGTGDSDLSYDLLRAAGVDLASGEPYRALARRMARITSELEELTRTLTISSPVPDPDTTRHTTAVDQSGMRFNVDILATGLTIPWGMAFVSRDSMIVTERAAGRIALINLRSGLVTRLTGTPPVLARVDGGMLDVALHPSFATNRWIYYAYSSGTDSASATIVERARLHGTALTERQTLYASRPAIKSKNHYGARLALRNGFLYVTLGDRDERSWAQDLGASHGKIIRLHDDGRIPRDNPLVGRAGALPEIWSYGHRNPHGLVFHPVTGALWSNEHGPRGGDEVNIVRRGLNYGWPLATFGREYTGALINGGRTDGPGLEQPVYQFSPSIAPSGLMIYGGGAFPAWRGNVFTGGMAFRHLNMLVMRGGAVVREERLLTNLGWRIRDVRQGPDGNIYLAGEHGVIARISPAR